MNRKLLSKLPLILALLFCAYAYGLIVSSVRTQSELKEREVARTAAETQHHAAMLANYISEQRRDLVELADSTEINNYLTNLALGMSPRYGLLSSQDAIRDLFNRSFAKQELNGQQSYSRYLFLDEEGRTVVDTADGQPVPADIGGGEQQRVSVDRETSALMITSPVGFKGRRAGTVAVWSDIRKLVSFIVAELGQGYYPLLIDDNGAIVFSSNQAFDGAVTRQMTDLLRVPTGKAVRLAGSDAPDKMIVLRDAVPNAGLTMVTLISEEIVFSGVHSSAFLVIAAILPLFVLFITIFVETLRKRAAKVEVELQESRERLMEIADHLVEGIVLVKRNGEILLLNQTALRIAGCAANKAEMQGRPLDDLFTLSESDRRVSFKDGPWLSIIDGTSSAQFGDLSIATADGRILPVSIGVSPFEDGENGKAAIISFTNDEQLRNAQRELLQASRMASVGQLAAGIAHEINTPIQYVSDNLHFLEKALSALAPVLAAARNLAETKSACDEARSFIDIYEKGDIAYFSEEVPGAIRQSLEGVAQVSRIVLSMKEFSHPGPVGKSLANINKALESTATVSRNNWKSFAVIETKYDPGLPLVYCHLGEINQVFLNLIMNAAQAIEESGKSLPGRITISTRREGKTVVIEIADTGLGVPPELRERIFDPFFTTKPVGKGTGQGLAICLDVVTRKHGGRIDVGGVPGQGAVFTVTLPIGSDHEDGD